MKVVKKFCYSCNETTEHEKNKMFFICKKCNIKTNIDNNVTQLGNFLSDEVKEKLLKIS